MKNDPTDKLRAALVAGQTAITPATPVVARTDKPIPEPADLATAIRTARKEAK